MCDSYGRFNSVYQTQLYASVPLQAVRGGLASLARLFCYMHRHLVYEGACSDVTHTAFVLCVVGMEKRHLIRDQRCEGRLIPMIRSICKSKNDSVFM